MSKEQNTPDQAARPEAAAAAGKPLEAGAEGDVSLVEHDTLDSLQRELEQALAKADENWSLYLSARAEMENMRKRAARDLESARKFALEKFIAELLPVKDSLEMGLAAATETAAADVDKLLEGTRLTLKLLAAALEKAGVSELNPLGARFNPEFHEAMAMQPTGKAEPNTVTQVIQKGYLLNDRLVRPAMVIVAQGGKKPGQGD
ncbi:MAG: nucleotide exchange factor GrpE [Pseudomonadota bacterium]|nr:nucleotide exchange factor GrpE [Pseudomonadota bacterium]